MSNQLSPEEARKLEEYQRLSALFQFYLELAFKAFTFALGMAGAVSAFVLKRENADPHIASFGLLLPSLLCFGMGLAFIRSVPSAKELNQALQELKTGLNCRLAPHATNLVNLLFWFGSLLVVSSLFLLLLFIRIRFNLP